MIMYPTLNECLECGEIALPDDVVQSGAMINGQFHTMETLFVRNPDLKQVVIVKVFISERMKKLIAANDTIINYLQRQPNVLAWIFSYAKRGPEIPPIAARKVG